MCGVELSYSNHAKGVYVIMPTETDMHASRDDMHRTAHGDDIPSLLAWIKTGCRKSRQSARKKPSVGFFRGKFQCFFP